MGSTVIPRVDDFQAMALQTYDCFFYGTLMVPAILTRVLGREDKQFRFQDAILLDHTRHCVKAADYPGVISKADAEKLTGRNLTQEEASVRGTLVKGLSLRDMKALDVFEGDEYKRQIVAIHTISEPSKLTDLPEPGAPSKPSISFSQLLENAHRVPATTYIYTAGLNRLEPAVWSLGDFLRDKADRWTGPSDEYNEVDEHRAQDSDLPELGKNLLQFWGFDKDYISINNGSYGAPPLPVNRALTALSARVERNPDLFHKRDYLPLLTEVRQKVADLIHADLDEVVMVSNTTHGVNLIIANTVWKTGDVILTYGTTYNAISQVVKHACDTNPDLSLHVVDIQFPTTHKAVIEETERIIASYNAPSAEGPVSKGKQQVRMVIMDAIASNPGVIYPWRQIVQVCKKYGVLSLVDAAHEIGQLETNVTESGCDFWVSNCHKWLMAHRSVAAVYVPFRNQHLIRTTFPTGVSYESTKYPTAGADRPWSFINQFNWHGTIDWKPILSVTPALEFREFLGGERRINKYCHELAVNGGNRMAEILGTEVMENEFGELTANMANVAFPSIPEPSSVTEQWKQAKFMQDSLFDKGIFGPCFRHNGKWWIRASAQVWNDLSDFEKLAQAVQEISDDLNAAQVEN